MQLIRGSHINRLSTGCDVSQLHGKAAARDTGRQASEFTQLTRNLRVHIERERKREIAGANFRRGETRRAFPRSRSASGRCDVAKGCVNICLPETDLPRAPTRFSRPNFSSFCLDILEASETSKKVHSGGSPIRSVEASRSPSNIPVFVDSIQTF